MESQGKGVGGPLEVAVVKELLQLAAGVAGQGELLQLGGEALFVVIAVQVLEDGDGIALEEFFIDGIH